ncbi:MAG: NAD(P)-binding domain-containing protein [Acidobacteria bacterium]|nr:NAD(P)-binding domain-containing protein [Acidobacteriota bacterium]
MKTVHFIICLALIGLLIWLNQMLVPADVVVYGGLTWVGWTSILFVGFGIGFLVIFNDFTRSFGFLKARDEQANPQMHVRRLARSELVELGLDKYRGPAYPHPVIFPVRCIGCQACVDACPHDVLAIVDGVAAAVAPDLCMEDTACQAECPVNPKACIVINTTKDVRTLPMPTRDGSTLQTNVPGCFIIGDVSGVPLIKNAVKEGADVIAHIAAELMQAPHEPKAAYDVAIIGIGPGGASAAASAADANLRYLAIEQDKVLSTVDQYPKGKYIFFKPDTKDWFGGIPTVGLGLATAKADSRDSADADSTIFDALDRDLEGVIHNQISRIHTELIAKIPRSLQPDLSPLLTEKIETELKKRIADFLRSKANGDWLKVYQTHFLSDRDNIMSGFRADIADHLETKIAGDQRENILDIWLGNLAEKGITINEYESCKAVTHADDGDYFVITTERDSQKTTQIYTARRVVIAIGLRGSPNKLMLPNEGLKVRIEGHDKQKVLYGLSNPDDFGGFRIVIVGGGNVAVEAAVDLVSIRQGTTIEPRSPEKMNRVTLLVRDYLAPTVKFGNKFELYKCADEGLIDLRFGVGIKEMRENELVLEDVGTKREVETIPNDYVLALIGGERPNRFLESIGITIK